QDVHAPSVLERVQGHLGGEVAAGARSACEGDRRSVAIAYDAPDEILELRQLRGVDVRDRGLEQLRRAVAEHRAAGRVRCDEPVFARVEHERGIPSGPENVVERQACSTPSTETATFSG